MALTLKPVQSGMFSDAGYDDDTWTLGLRFKTGLTLLYSDVPPEVADEFLNAESLGKHYNTIFKGLGFKAIQDPSAPPVEKKEEPKKPVARVETTIDDDIRLVDPSWTGQPEEESELEPILTANVKVVAPFFEEPAKIVHVPAPEILVAWEPPKDVIQALTMMETRKGEIAAIIKQNYDQAKDAMAIRVTDHLSHAGASQVLKNLVNTKDRTEKLLDPFRSVIYLSYKTAADNKQQAMSSIDGAISYIKGCLSVYEANEQRKHQEQVRASSLAAQEEARKLQAQRSEQLTLAEMTDALESGDTERAEELAANPIEVPLPYVAPPHVAPSILPPEGQSLRDNWSIRKDSVDLSAFLAAVKDGRVSIEKAAQWLEPNFKALDKMAKSLTTAFDIPGFQAENNPVRVVRRGK